LNKKDKRFDFERFVEVSILVVLQNNGRGYKGKEGHPPTF